MEWVAWAWVLTCIMLGGWRLQQHSAIACRGPDVLVPLSAVLLNSKLRVTTRSLLAGAGTGPTQLNFAWRPLARVTGGACGGTNPDTCRPCWRLT
jgi:hypothetical protein